MTTNPTPAQALEAVMALSEKATPGEWRAFTTIGLDVEGSEHEIKRAVDDDWSIYCGAGDELGRENAKLITAAVNFIREHGQHFAGLEAEVERLTAERDTYCAQNRELRDGVLPMLKRAETAEAELAKAQADAERLDWLSAEWDKHGCISASRYSVGHAGCNLFTVSSQHVRAIGLRAAIDAARADRQGQGAN